MDPPAPQPDDRSAAVSEHSARPRSSPLWLLLLTAVLLGFLVMPPVRGQRVLTASFAAVAGVLLAWQALLAWRSRRGGAPFLVLPEVVRAHYVQAAVQGCVYLYWGWHRREVCAELLLIAAQVVFLYLLGALLAWSRGRPWRLGFGPLPIVFSTNLLLWFQRDWYFLQFLMLATGALGKEFVTWRRDGRRVHVFNPSVFGQVAFALLLIATGTTRDLTHGTQIAASFESVPHMHVLLFLLGLVVQGLFSTTLMTLSAAAVLCLLNVAYTTSTGVYYFMSVNIGATVFLGMHLLITDPSTSPRSNVGRVLFGGLYALGYAALYRMLGSLGVPLFWDKLLPVPLLNLAVPLLDRLARAGPGGALERAWTSALRPARLNLLHMGVWAALFAALLATRFVDAPHEGATIAFWKRAYAEGRSGAGENLLRLATFEAERSDPEACDTLGMLHLEGKLVEQDPMRAAFYFEQACALGNIDGCRHVVSQFVVLDQVRTPGILRLALDRLEESCGEGADGLTCFLVGRAYEIGRGRPRDLPRALALYRQGCSAGSSNACKGAARLAGAAGPERAAPADGGK